MNKLSFYILIFFIAAFYKPSISQETPEELKFAQQDTLSTKTSQDSVITSIKSPRGAMLRSVALPGWGQLYNGKKFKALLFGGTEIGLIVNAVIQNHLANQSTTTIDHDFYIDNRNLSFWWLAAAILISMTDAYVDAQLFDFDESPNLTYYQYKNNEPSSIIYFCSLNIKLGK